MARRRVERRTREHGRPLGRVTDPRSRRLGHRDVDGRQRRRRRHGIVAACETAAEERRRRARQRRATSGRRAAEQQRAAVREQCGHRAEPREAHERMRTRNPTRQGRGGTNGQMAMTYVSAREGRGALMGNRYHVTRVQEKRGVSDGKVRKANSYGHKQNQARHRRQAASIGGRFGHPGRNP